MGYFNNTLLGKIVLPRHKKVSGWLDDAYKYKVNEALKETFIAFCNQQKSIGYSVDETALLWIAVQINSLGNFEVKLQTSSDLQTWSPTTPGVFPYGDNTKFFRLIVE